jgi:hypothetical protein
MSEPPQSNSLDLVLYILQPVLFMMCAFLILSLLVYLIIAFNSFVSVACILLSCLLMLTHVFTPYNRIFLKYTLCIVVLHSLRLCFMLCSLLNCEIVKSFLFFRLFHFCISSFFSTTLPR